MCPPQPLVFSVAVMFPEPKFYKAHTEYNPRFMSDNVGMEDDELEFKAGDVIKVKWVLFPESSLALTQVSVLIPNSGYWNGKSRLANRSTQRSARSGAYHLCECDRRSGADSRIQEGIRLPSTPPTRGVGGQQSPSSAGPAGHTASQWRDRHQRLVLTDSDHSLHLDHCWRVRWYS